MNEDIGYSFEAKLWDSQEWMRSAGKWDKAEDAASAAGLWLSAAAETGHEGAHVRLVFVREWALLS